MITRIMMIGAGRIHEAACTLSFDNNLTPQIDQTIIVSPYSWVTLIKEFELFGINSSNFKFYSDEDVVKKFNLDSWTANHWYLQQGIKFNLLDHIDSDFLIQDCDVFAIRPYNFFIDKLPVFRVEELWNNYQQVYALKVKKLLGYERAIPYSFVTEFMPYTKEDWNLCKNHIENRNNKSWQDTLFGIAPFDDTKWLSEYEILGIFKTNKDNNYHLVIENYPEINSFEDFFHVDWNTTDTVKFKSKPFKYMGRESAMKIKDFFNKQFTTYNFGEMND